MLVCGLSSPKKLYFSFMQMYINLTNVIALLFLNGLFLFLLSRIYKSFQFFSFF